MKLPRKIYHLSKSAQLLVLLTLFAVALIVVFLWRGFSWLVQPVSQPTPKPLPSGFFQVNDLAWKGMEFAPVRRMHFSAVEDTDGTIAAADENTTQVFSPYSGRVTAVYATTGDYVRAGQPLFTVAATEYAQAQNNLIAATTALDVARKTLVQALHNRARQLALLERGGAAQKDVEQSAVDLATAQANVKNDQIALNLVRGQMLILGQSNAQIAALSRAASTSVKLGGAVAAPISGYVTARSIGVGQNIGSATNGGSTPLFTISDLSTVYFVAYVSETAIASIHVGDPVVVRLEAFPGRTFDATVRYISATVDPNLHRVAVRAVVDNAGGALRPGMFGSFRIYTGAGSASLAVPEYAVIYEEDTARVWITGPNETLALRYIKAGKTVDGMVQVLSGLRSGDTVVTSGTVFIDRALRGDQ
jgi:membrane fusion protein, heavy metal efflux system